MPPFVALILWLVCLILLFRFDPAREPRSSLALWIPVIWMSLLGSKNPSAWFGGGGSTVQSLEEGSPLDRVIYLLLMGLAIWVLQSRSFKLGPFLMRNAALTVFVSFALLSASWSDFPLTCLKRWFRDMGGYLVILVVLSDPRPREAVGVVIRRISYLLIPLSIMLDKYFPGIGRSFDPWTGIGFYQGVTTGKNLLGSLALISGLYFVCDTIARWPERKQKRIKRILFVNGAFVAMSVSLLQEAKSTTSQVCFGIGCMVIAAVQSKKLRRRSMLLKTMIPAMFCLYVVLAFMFNQLGSMAQAVGKDPSLTDRTKIWSFLLSMHTNPIIGTGYQSFWLGPRLEMFWSEAGLGHINEAHNGFLEIYLELGLIGVIIIVMVLIGGYRNICRRLSPFSSIAPLSFAIWITLLFYSMAEAGFEFGLFWCVFLMTNLAVPRFEERRVRNATIAGHLDRGKSLGEFSGAVMMDRNLQLDLPWRDRA
jgi:exopolysaccharide production protein ExoQ